MKKNFILIILLVSTPLFLLSLSACTKKIKLGFWETKGGGNCLYFDSDTTVLLYQFDENNKRVEVGFKDVIFEQLYWEIKSDSLYIKPNKYSNVSLLKYKIIFVDESDLRLIKVNETTLDTRFIDYKYSKDQTSMPRELEYNFYEIDN